MFCYQCEQTVAGKGCLIQGNCGKDAKTAALQDVLLHVAEGLAMFASRGFRDEETDTALIEALFTTVTNVNFDPERLAQVIGATAAAREKARALYVGAAGAGAGKLGGAADFIPGRTTDDLLAQGAGLSLERRMAEEGADLTGLKGLLTYGVKGAAAYAHHARVLGRDVSGPAAFFAKALDVVAREGGDIGELLGLCLECGKVNLETMAALDEANTGTYGHPVPTEVRVEPVAGKAIVVSGHDLKDLEELLRQTENAGVNVYTHGEMLPAHGYPGLKKYRHLVGNYGGAWQDQVREFAAFPGAVLMTTNCIQRPAESCKGRIFTSGLVAWPGVRHISDRDFAPVIEAALAAPGFTEDGPDKRILVGFGRNAVLGVADKVVEAVRSGAIRHFFLIGGCDGARSGRDYYTEFAQQVPQDCVILTLACGKYRFNKLDFGSVAGLPRLLDVGQCNDAYSAIQIAVALAAAFKTDVNGLPLSLVLSWYEQKAVAILLTLLHLGIRNIRLGPTLPAFVTPTVLNVLVEKFALQPIGEPAADLEAILG